MFKIGDTVRFKGYRTEYEIVKIRSLKFVDIKITKFDPRYLTNIHPLGTVYINNPASHLEIIHRARRHPLTDIFR